jgi:acetyl esterase/lipase
MYKKNCFAFVCIACLACGSALAQPKPYTVIEDIVYTEAKGRALTLDIFVPSEDGRFAYLKPGDAGEGIGLIDVISGGWNDSKARQREHEDAAVFKVLCARKFTVFAIRPGGLPHFTGLEMAANLKRGIRWVKAHAEAYGIDPDRLGLMGASAGGHLATLAMVTPETAEKDAADPLLKYDTTAEAVAVFFPPVDFINWTGEGVPANPAREPYLAFSDGVEGKDPGVVSARMAELSPALRIRGKTPPLLLVHGDADPIVPLYQSEQMVKAMKTAGNEVELIVKKGGGHFWLSIPQEMIKVADWFAAKLGKSLPLKE